MLDFYSSISLNILRDYLLFLVSVLVVAVVIGIYINMKSYILTRRIESRMNGIQRLKDNDSIVSELNSLNQLSAQNFDIKSAFGPVSRLLDVYGVTICDREGKIIFANEKFMDCSGYSRDDLIGSDHSILSSRSHPTDFWQSLYADINQGRLWHGVIKNARKDGGGYYWADTLIIPLDVFTHLQGFISIRSDVTEVYSQNDQFQKQLRHVVTQLQDSEKLLERTDRMATLGFLVAGIAHELNNPLSYVSSNIAMLDKYIEPVCKLVTEIENINFDEVNPEQFLDYLWQVVAENKLGSLSQEAQEIVAETGEGIERMIDIIQDIRMYSHAGADGFHMCNINTSIHRVINLVKGELGHRVRVKLDLCDQDEIFCNEGKIQQVLLNIIINACQAIVGEGMITIATSVEHPKWFRISITDTGEGIPDDCIRNIFQPFFTTKPPGTGTGLGLSISNQIVKMHAGKIECASRQGKGTRFTISLPRQQVNTSSLPENQSKLSSAA